MTQTQIVAEPGVPYIVITREFDAPRDLLFRAHVDPELLVQWLGPRRLTMTIDHLDARDGGRWRFTHRDADGTEYGFHGVYHGTPSPAGIVSTWEFEGTPGHVSLETATFSEHGGRTLLRTHAVYQSVEDRDAHVQSGMEAGVEEGWCVLRSSSPGWPRWPDAVRLGLRPRQPLPSRGRTAGRAPPPPEGPWAESSG